MKTKFIIAVLFCAALFTSCSKNENENEKDPVQELIDALNLQAGVGNPSVTATPDGICISADVNISTDLNDVLDSLANGADITTPVFSLNTTAVGPGKAKIGMKLCFKTNASNTGSIEPLTMFPSASAQPKRSQGKGNITITGSNQCHTPYDGTEPIVFHVTGYKAGSWICISYPTNTTTYSSGAKTMEGGIYLQIPASGVLDYTFNSNPNDPLFASQNASTPKWKVAPGTYPCSVRAYKNSTWDSSVNIQIQ